MIYKAVIIKLWLPRYLITLPCFDLTFRKAHRRSGSCAYRPCHFERSFNKTFSLQVAVQRRTTSCCTKQCFSEREEIIGIFSRLNSSSEFTLQEENLMENFLLFYIFIVYCLDVSIRHCRSCACHPKRKRQIVFANS